MALLLEKKFQNIMTHQCKLITCKDCNIVFEKKPIGRSPLRCPDCSKIAWKASQAVHNQANKEKRKEYNKQWIKDNRERYNEKQKRNRRKYKGILNATGESKSGNCDICNTFDKCLHLDHCHSSGKIRGWLCLKCNTALGKFKDDTRLLGTAIEYLNIHHTKELRYA
jgi:Autographiviridae endonuclease VII